jgi:hypothetical protein
MTSYSGILPSLLLQSQQSGFEQLGWHNIGWDLQNWVISLALPIVLLLVVFVIILVATRWHAKVTTAESKKRSSADRFTSAQKRLKLSEGDLACITLLKGFEPDAEPATIIERHDIFERCVHAAMTDAARRPPAELDEIARSIAALRKKIGLSVYPADKQLTSTRAIAIGQICSVFGASSNKEPIIKAAAVSTVTEQVLHLRYRKDDTPPPEIGPGTLVRIAFSRPHDGYYGAQVPVVSGPSAESIVLGHTIDMKRNQLRKFVRVSASTKIKCRLIKPASPKLPSMPTGKSIEVDMYDISGGGLSFTSAQQLHPGDAVTLSFHIGDTRISGLQSVILRVSERSIKGQQTFLHHCKFSPIETSDQEKIVKFTFERMRMLTTWNIKKFN